MRITDITLSFEDGKRVIEGYTTPGWYIRAADADADGHLWAIRPIKVTPEIAETIAESMSPALGGRAAAGIRRQNLHARDEARKAKERADALAAKAAEQADQLAQWEAAVSGDGSATPEPDEQHCLLLSTHEPHVWTHRERVEAGHSVASAVDQNARHRCSGVEHDHSARCCPVHGTHVNPHRGCLLR